MSGVPLLDQATPASRTEESLSGRGGPALACSVPRPPSRAGPSDGVGKLAERFAPMLEVTPGCLEYSNNWILQDMCSGTSLVKNDFKTTLKTSVWKGKNLE